MDRPILGERCTVSGKAVKTRRPGAAWYATNVKWNPVKLEPVNAMYIGYRRVFSGVTTVTDTESYFTPSTNHEVWLFVLNERKNPIYVFPEQVERDV